MTLCGRCGGEVEDVVVVEDLPPPVKEADAVGEEKVLWKVERLRFEEIGEADTDEEDGELMQSNPNDTTSIVE